MRRASGRTNRADQSRMVRLDVVRAPSTFALLSILFGIFWHRSGGIFGALLDVTNQPMVVGQYQTIENLSIPRLA